MVCIYKFHLEQAEYLPWKLKTLQAHRRVKSASSNMNALLLVAIVCSLQFKGGHTQGALFSFVLHIEGLGSVQNSTVGLREHLVTLIQFAMFFAF